ncbi:MAG TPA: PAS domain S-box protein [Desulfobacterales bacterium]|nr:PAS domain S-box protein [Desulfobacterales bacterium]
MAAKPTREELELKIEASEKEAKKLAQTEAELVKSKAMFKAVIESLPFDVFVVDPSNRYILQNSICKKNWGDLIGKSPENLSVNEKTKYLWMDNNRRALSGETVTGEVVYDRLDGGKNFYHNIVAPICNGKKILGIVGVLVDISDLKQTEALLRESESKLSAMLSSVGDHMSMMDKNLNIIWANEIAGKIFGNDIIGKKCYEVYHKRTEPCEPYPCITLRAFQDGKIHKHDTQVIGQDWETIFFHCTANVGLRDKEGKPTAVLEISRDITEKVRAGKALHKAKNELERRVKERTGELELKTKSLEEINTAMKVLLKKRQEDKTEIEDNVMTNVKNLVAPYFEKIKKTKLDDQQEAFLSIIESNLNEITSPFTRRMSLKYLNLTPTEIRIANLIRYGSSSKKIAELMNVSPRTIDTHRKNIRRKIGLQGHRGNLRSYLLSLY